MSSILTGYGYVIKTEEFFKENYIEALSREMNIFISEIMRNYDIGLLNLEEKGYIQDLILKNIKEKTTNFVSEMENLMPLFLSEDNNQFNQKFRDLIAKVNNYIAKEKALSMEVKTISNVYQYDIVGRYEALLSVKEFPERAKNLLKAKLTKLKAIEGDLRGRFKKEMEKIKQEFNTDIDTELEKDILNQTVEKAINISRIIEYLDESFHKKNISKLIENLSKIESSIEAELILEEIKLQYIRIKREKIDSEVYRQEILKMAHKSENDIKQELERVAQKKLITKEDFDKCIRLYTQNIDKQQHIEQEHILDAFNLTGYKAVIQDTHGVFYFDTPYGEDYKVRIKFEGNKISIQFVRLIEDDEKNISDYEKQVDLRKAKEFCQNIDSIFEILNRKYGIMIDISRRIEPEERMFYIRWKDVPAMLKNKKAEKKEEEKRLSL